MVCTFNVCYLCRDRGRWSCALAHWNRTAEYSPRIRSPRIKRVRGYSSVRAELLTETDVLTDVSHK